MLLMMGNALILFLTALCLSPDALAFAPSSSSVSARRPTGVLRAATDDADASKLSKVSVDKTKEGEYPHPHDDDYQFGDITKRMIRDMVGNTEYEFGDGSKAIASATTDAAEAAASAVIEAGGSAVEAGAAARKVLDESGYEFGDVTKGAIKGFEETMKDATGNEDYKFGDVTKGLVTSLGKQATGNEDYKFGDVTKNLAKGLFGAVEKGAAAAKKKVDEPEK